MVCGNYFCVVLYFLFNLSKIVSLPLKDLERKGSTSTFLMVKDLLQTVYGADYTNRTQLFAAFELDDDETHLPNGKRVKRQGGKFHDASRMPQTKMLRLMLQLARNPVKSNLDGPTHPLDPKAPMIFIRLFSSKVFNFFTPDISEPPKVEQTA